MLTLDDLRTGVTEGSIDTVVAAFPDHYGRLMGKRFDGHFFVEEAVREGTHVCDYLLTTDIDMDPVPGYEFANWDLGYGDLHLVPDLGTLRQATWLDRTAVVLCDVETTDHDPVAVAPRTVLQRQIEQLANAGFTAKAASELEYYLFTDSYRTAAGADYQGLQPFGWYREDYNILQGTREEPYNAEVRRHLTASGIPVETSKGEWGKGQHEMNVRYAAAGEMADRHTLMKLAMKEIADLSEVSVTFMAKPFDGQAGSSCHIHMSLWRGDENAFGESDVFGGFLAGLLRRLRDITVLLAPTINSYKRFEDGSWAPTRLAWSSDNRTAALRVVGSGSARRVECRIPGADCNPYLAYAGLLAAGLEGIVDGLAMPTEFEGDLYQAGDVTRLPSTLAEATGLFASSEFAGSVLGDPVHDHYSHFFRSEVAAFDASVTDWERRRYFERI